MPMTPSGPHPSPCLSGRRQMCGNTSVRTTSRIPKYTTWAMPEPVASFVCSARITTASRPDSNACSAPIMVLGLVSIEVTKMPDTTEFTEGDLYDYSGIEITAHFDDGTTQVVTGRCAFNPAPGTQATVGTNTVTVTFAPNAVSTASTNFAITVQKKSGVKVRAIELLPTTYEESLERIKSVLSINSKMLQRIESKRSSVFGGASLNIVLAAGYCNYKGSGATRYVLMDITPWVGTGKYLYEFKDPATGLSQGIAIPSEDDTYHEFYPHQYMWENCQGNSMFFVVGYEGEIQKDGSHGNSGMRSYESLTDGTISLYQIRLVLILYMALVGLWVEQQNIFARKTPLLLDVKER